MVLLILKNIYLFIFLVAFIALRLEFRNIND